MMWKFKSGAMTLVKYIPFVKTIVYLTSEISRVERKSKVCWTKFRKIEGTSPAYDSCSGMQ